MKRTILFTSALATAIGMSALGATAQQQTPQTPQQQRMSVSQIATMLEEKGYKVREIELERGRYDVEMIDGNGMKVEAHLDPATGAVMPYRDDEDGYHGTRGDNDRYERDDD